MDLKDKTNHLIAIITVIILSYLIMQKNASSILDFFWTTNYYYIVYFAIIAAFLFVFLKMSSYFKDATGYLKHPAFFIFLPFALFPVVRCYFKMPFICGVE